MKTILWDNSYLFVSSSEAASATDS